jgi:site-specific DNA-methyltransferase (adenine-specific)
MIDHLLGRVHCGDNLAELKKLPDNCVDSVVCDPPYGLQFMGKNWDYDVPKVETWREVLRVLKPGGYLLSFFGTRTYHRGVIAIEDAGFEIRDQIGWCYGSGFPKSHDISKAIDREAGAERDKIKTPMGPTEKGYHESAGNTPATAAAAAWKGWGTALKPAWEPICVARKPISEDTIAANVLKHSTGAINIDGCRVGTEARHNPSCKTDGGPAQVLTVGRETVGRWPANLITDGSEEVLQAFPNAPGQQFATGPKYGAKDSVNAYGDYAEREEFLPRGDSGSAARFFYTAKASKWDRNEDCDNLEVKQSCGGGGMNNTEDDVCGKYGSIKVPSKNHHPTVKPTDLMQYLCRLVTPPNGIILDPYSGSGSTGKAALLECFRFIGYEREAEYCKIANARIANVKGQLKLF